MMAQQLRALALCSWYMPLILLLGGRGIWISVSSMSAWCNPSAEKVKTRRHLGLSNQPA